MTLFEHGDTPLPRPQRRPMSRAGVRRTIVSSAISAAVILASLLLVFASQWLGDAWRAWTAHPTPELSALMTDATMTDHARFVFLAASPEVQSLQQVNDACSGTDRRVQVLGCYLAGGPSIHIARVGAPGVEAVTAAHEMLHAAWDRTAEGERSTLERELEAAYARLAPTHPALVATMAVYARTEPGARDDELHSILGTELPDLGPALEHHYAEYFADRAALVARDPDPL